MHALVLSLLLANGDGLKVALEDCPRVDARELRQLILLELGTRTDATFRFRCDERAAHLEVTSGERTERSDVSLREVPTVAVARTLALAAMEALLLAREPVQHVERSSIVPAPAVVPRPAARWWLSLGGAAEYGGGWVLGPRLSLRFRLWRELFVALEAGWLHGVDARGLGVAYTNSADGAVSAGVALRAGDWAFPLGVGVRAGGVWLSASPLEGATAGAVQGLRGGPFAFGGVAYFLAPWLTLGLELQAGWLFGGARGTIDGGAPVTAAGFAGAGLLAVGSTW